MTLQKRPTGLQRRRQRTLMSTLSSVVTGQRQDQHAQGTVAEPVLAFAEAVQKQGLSYLLYFHRAVTPTLSRFHYWFGSSPRCLYLILKQTAAGEQLQVLQSALAAWVRNCLSAQGTDRCRHKCTTQSNTRVRGLALKPLYTRTLF